MAWVPQACTLPTAEQPLRVEEFDALLASSVRPAERVEPTWLRVHLPAGDDVVATARDLSAREVRCCSFFSFALHPTAAATVLDVRVPQARTSVLDALEQMTRPGGG